MASAAVPPEPRTEAIDDDDELEQLEREIMHDDYRDQPDSDLETGSTSTPVRSQYAQTRRELTRAIANRFVHSRTYIFLYLGMAALSVTTVVLSLVEGCPGVAFYVLEIIINTSMIVEVVVRFLAFGNKFWKSPYNYIDIFLTLLCAVTLLVLGLSGCTTTSKEEELLDTILLVARNILQFTRLASVLRRSGRSIFARPTPIDLSAARRQGYALDIDLYDESAQLAEEDPEAAHPLVSGAPAGVVFDAAAEGQGNGVRADRTKIQGMDPGQVEDVWASVG